LPSDPLYREKRDRNNISAKNSRIRKQEEKKLRDISFAKCIKELDDVNEQIAKLENELAEVQCDIICNGF